MDYRDWWQERFKKIHAGSVTMMIITNDTDLFEMK